MKRHLLLLHGALGSQEQLVPLEKALDNQFQVHRLNFSGHGGLPLEGSYSIDQFIENISDYIRIKDLPEVSLFGFSMGGYVAIHYAARKPALVNKIVTLGTKFDWSPAIAEKEVKMLDPEKIEKKVPAYSNHLKQTHRPVDWKEVVNHTAKMMTDLGHSGGINEQVLSVVNHPTLILRGELDKMVNHEESFQTANKLSNGSFRSLQGFKHPIEQIDTKQLAKTIIDFI